MQWQWSRTSWTLPFVQCLHINLDAWAIVLKCIVEHQSQLIVVVDDADDEHTTMMTVMNLLLRCQYGWFYILILFCSKRFCLFVWSTASCLYLCVTPNRSFQQLNTLLTQRSFKISFITIYFACKLRQFTTEFRWKKIVVNFCFWSEQRVRVGKKATFYQTTSQIAWVHVTLFQWTWAWHELQLRAIASTHAIRSWNNAKLLLLHTMILIEWVFSFFLSFFLLRRAHKNSLFLLPSWILCESLTSRQNMKKNS